MAAAVTTQEASSSVSRCTYHVFLSFRGEDTRTNFTSHLYEALKQAGIHTFLDDDGIERGENIEAELQKAIKESKISIIVFSSDYASSTRCLDELVMIMEQRKAVGLIVLPVFYKVDPSQVRKQTKSFAAAFVRHEMRFTEEMDKVKRWRAALSEVADLAGMPLNNRHEAQFIQDIVREIQEKLKGPVLMNVAPHLVGIGSRVKDINGWLQDGSSDIGIATIFGIGGIGKTTIAKTVYNQNFGRFQGRSFLSNVKDTSKEANGLVRLQNQLLSNLLNGKMNEVKSVDEGVMKIKDAIHYRKVLIVFDDVDQLDQLDSIIGMQEWLYPGSKIIITTRNAGLLRAYAVCVEFEVKELDDNESLQLFSWHAFRHGHPIEGYMDCSRKVVDRCEGLPLALKVFGRSLFGKSIDVWESALHKLEAIADNEIQEVLKISYDSLKDDHDKNLFLDIACFFIGEDKDYTVAILDGCGFFTHIGIDNLINRCLLTVDEQNMLIMHQLIRDMGREVIRQESTDDPGKRSRLWLQKDAFTILKEKTGTEIVKGLTLDLRRFMKDKYGKTSISENYAEMHHDEDYLNKSTIENCSKRHRLSFLSWQQSLFLSNEVDLETKTFMKMHKLKLLQLNYVKLKGDFKDFSKNLIWLCWHGFPLESIPINFNLEKLVALDMRYSSLKHVWKGKRFLAELKFLNLSHSHCLLRTPDFSGLPSLERLMLVDCINLVEIDESIGNLHRLVFLDLSGCKNLRKFPREIGMLKSLKDLLFSGCSKLFEEELGKLGLLLKTSWYSTFCSWFSPTRTPHSTSFSLAFLPPCLSYINLEDCNLSDSAISHGFASLPSLKILNLSGNPLHSLPKSIKGLTKLKTLVLSNCKELQSMSFSSAFLPDCLLHLNLENCNLSDNAVSHGFAGLSSLQILNLRENPFHSLPKSIKGLTKLETIVLTDCKELQSIPKFPNSLKDVIMYEIPKSQNNWMDLLTYGMNVFGEHGLWIVGCENLVEIEGIFKLEPLENADVRVLNSLGLSNLEPLRSIEVDLISIYPLQKRRIPLQVLLESDVLNIFLPRSQIPNSQIPSCFDLHSMRHSISFDVPPHIGHKICGLNLCIVYGFKFDLHGPWDFAMIRNKTKRVRWSYSPLCFASPNEEDIDKGMLWLSYWKIGNQLEVGDQIDVSVQMNHVAKICGFRLVYEPEDNGNQSNTEEIVRSAFPWYQTVTHTEAGADAYFRCHHSYDFHRFINVFKRDPCFLCKMVERDRQPKNNSGPLPG